MAVVISLNWFVAPVDDTVTAEHQSQVTSHKSARACAGRLYGSQMMQWVNAVETLGTLSRQGNVAVVLANGVWALPQGNVYVGHSLNDATARAKLASAGSADVVLVRANGEGVLQRKRFVAVCTSESSPQQDSSLALPSLSR